MLTAGRPAAPCVGVCAGPCGRLMYRRNAGPIPAGGIGFSARGKCTTCYSAEWNHADHRVGRHNVLSSPIAHELRAASILTRPRVVDDVARSASLTVCESAVDVDDARFLLTMLGLLDDRNSQ